ncbi:MAG: hypothetical protein ACQERD_02560 [Campylobacterota bacterium]
MVYFKYIFLTFLVFFVVGCTSKNQPNFNNNLTSISLSDDILVAQTPKTVKSPVSLNLGFGGYIFKNMGVHIGSSVTPDIKNSKGLNFQKALQKFNISLESEIKEEFTKQMRSDNFYKDKYVPFGANNSIHLHVIKYEIDKSLFTNNAYMKIYMQLKVINEKNEQLYSETLVNETNLSSNNYKLSEVFLKRELFLELLHSCVSNLIKKHIKSMKKL